MSEGSQVVVTRAASPRGGGRDPVVSMLRWAIAFMFVTAISLLAYIILPALTAPSTPRTSVEMRLVVLENAINATPGSGSAWADYIRALVSIKDYGKAQRMIELARKVVKGDQRVHVDLAAVDMLLIQKKFKEADKLSDKLIDEDKQARSDALKRMVDMGTAGINPWVLGAPQGTRVYVAKARVLAEQGKWDRAVKAMTTALMFSPNDADLLVMRADAWIHLGKKNKARKDLRDALKVDPDNTRAASALKAIGE